MGEKGHRWMGRAVRRGVALGLALIAGWALYLTSDPAVAASLTDGTAWQVAVLKGQLYPLSGQTSGLTGRCSGPLPICTPRKSRLLTHFRSLFPPRFLHRPHTRTTPTTKANRIYSHKLKRTALWK